MDKLSLCQGFQWDQGNSQKNWTKHHVTASESEQVFFNRPLVVDETTGRSNEARYYALGQTDKGRTLFVVFTIRENLVRVISARPMSRVERRIYQNDQTA